MHVQEGFPCFLTTAHSDADLDFVRDAFHRSLREMHAGQALGAAHATQPDLSERPARRDSPAGPPADEAQLARGAAASTLEVDLEPVAREIPITEPQREILFGTQLGDEANCAFNESTSLVLDGNLE